VRFASATGAKEMGEAKRKQYSREQFLREHPFCAYCGEPATTTDHCPPRCFFEQRLWPETYEFPACDPCNEEGRLDEQALAVLTRLNLIDVDTEPGLTEWKSLLDGVRNNQPEILAEWGDISASRRKRVLRDAFGQDGDRMRWAGWGAIKLGPQTRGAIDRFCIKLGKALYYRHLHEVFEGDIYIRHVDAVIKDKDPELLKSLLQFAPQLAAPLRSMKSLADQFNYAFNESKNVGVLYAVVEFNPHR
jgi:hypothetical protein